MKRIALIGLGVLAFLIWFLIIGHSFEFKTVPELILSARPSPSPVLKIRPYRSESPRIASPNVIPDPNVPSFAELQRRCRIIVTTGAYAMNSGEAMSKEDIREVKKSCKVLFEERGY